MLIFNLNTIICLITIIIINYVLSKNNFLIDKPELSHHKFKHKKIIALSGGLYFFISFFVISIIQGIDNKILIYLFPLLFIGIIADIRKSFSPNLRLVFQILFFISLVYFLRIKISSIDLELFDFYLKNNLFNIFFVVFCTVTVLNGHNFMDGLNGFVTGKFLLILVSIYYIISTSGINFEDEFTTNVKILFIIILIFFSFNILGLCFSGDNGIYIFSTFISLTVINFIEFSNNQISPIIGATFLWYPAFENLFSIIRRLKKKENISNPDNLHLHTLLNTYLKKKFKNKLNSTQLNSLSGLLINIFLIPNFFLSVIWFNNSFNLMLLVITQIIIYMFAYVRLLKFNL